MARVPCGGIKNGARLSDNLLTFLCLQSVGKADSGEADGLRCASQTQSPAGSSGSQSLAAPRARLPAYGVHRIALSSGSSTDESGSFMPHDVCAITDPARRQGRVAFTLLKKIGQGGFGACFDLESLHPSGNGHTRHSSAASC